MTSLTSDLSRWSLWNWANLRLRVCSECSVVCSEKKKHQQKQQTDRYFFFFFSLSLSLFSSSPPKEKRKNQTMASDNVIILPGAKLSRKPYVLKTDAQLGELEKAYQANPTRTPDDILGLASRISLPVASVKEWFKTKRKADPNRPPVPKISRKGVKWVGRMRPPRFAVFDLNMKDGGDSEAAGGESSSRAEAEEEEEEESEQMAGGHVGSPTTSNTYCNGLLH